jgi:hypothetical protein
MLDALARIVDQLEGSPAPSPVTGAPKPAPALGAKPKDEPPDDLGWEAQDDKGPANDTKKQAIVAKPRLKKKKRAASTEGADKPAKKRDEGEQDA